MKPRLQSDAAFDQNIVRAMCRRARRLIFNPYTRVVCTALTMKHKISCYLEKGRERKNGPISLILCRPETGAATANYQPLEPALIHRYP
jgi:hypothetical protein